LREQGVFAQAITDQFKYQCVEAALPTSTMALTQRRSPSITALEWDNHKQPGGGKHFIFQCTGYGKKPCRHSNNL